jgi:hypothetical protein
MRNAYRILIGKPEREECGKLVRRRENDIKMDLKQIHTRNLFLNSVHIWPTMQGIPGALS